MALLTNLWIFVTLLNTLETAVPNYEGCEFYMDKMTQLYGNHFPLSNSVFRDPDEDGVEGFFKFLRKPGNLVIAMDRSEGFSAYFFYLMQRPFIEFILRNHVVVDANHTRLAVMTFAKDLTVLYDGISYDSDLDKCSFFEVEGPWSNTLYNRNPDVSQGTYIDQALSRAFNIITNSGRNVPSAVLVVTDGSWNVDRNPRIEHIMSLIKNADIEVYSMMSGVYGISQYGNVKDVATAKDHYAEEATWVKAALSLTPAIKWFTPGAPWSCSHDSCCHPVAGNVTESNPGSCRRYRCKNGGLCVDGNGVAVCLCRLGFHGHYCQHSVNDCLQDACPKETECEDMHHRFTCTCPNKTEDCLEVLNSRCGYIPGKHKDSPASTDGNGKYLNNPGNGTIPTWSDGPSWGQTTIHQYHFININAIIAIVCVCLVLLFAAVGITFCVRLRQNPAAYNEYRERGKKCLCCVKHPPEAVQASTNSALPGTSVSMETYPGAVANPVHEAGNLPPKVGSLEDDDSDIFQRPWSISSTRRSSRQTGRSAVPTISQTMAVAMAAEPPPYSSIYQGTSRHKLSRRDSQQPLLGPSSPDSLPSGSTSPLTDLYQGGFDPYANTLDPDMSDLDLENNNVQPQASGNVDINNFRDLPVNTDIDYDISVASNN